jgi:hypothetical protein
MPAGLARYWANRRKSKNGRRVRYSNRRRSRKSNRRSSRRHRNPAIALGRGAIGRLTTGFKPSVLIDAGLIGAGAFGNAYIRSTIGTFIPQVTSGIPSYLAGLATSGLLLFVPKFGQKLFIGGVFGEVYRAAREFIPQVKQLGDYLDTGARIGDYLEQGQLSQYADDDESLSEYYEDSTATGSGDLATQAASTFE